MDRQCPTRNVSLAGEIIKVKTKVFSERLGLPEGPIKFYSRYLQRLQKRNKLRSIRIHVGSSSGKEESMEAALTGLRPVIARYKPQDVFNIHETGMSRLKKS